MKYGFTATRQLSVVHWPRVHALLKEFHDGTEFITGCAPGGDTYIAITLAKLYPRAVHRLIIPHGPHNKKLVEQFQQAQILHSPLPGENIVLQPMRAPAVPGVPAAMRERNAAIVNRCDRLVGVALHEEQREPRSGTWMTVRMGRFAGKMWRVIVLEPA